MARKNTNGIKIDMEQLQRLQYAFEILGDRFPDEVTAVAGAWADRTESIYRSRVKYGNGFRRVNPRYQGLTAYSDSERTTSGFRAEVGHECYVAKFLEIGTKNHEIKPGVKVSGIQGSHALKKVIDGEIDNLYQNIETYVDKKLSND